MKSYFFTKTKKNRKRRGSDKDETSFFFISDNESFFLLCIMYVITNNMVQYIFRKTTEISDWFWKIPSKMKVWIEVELFFREMEISKIYALQYFSTRLIGSEVDDAHIWQYLQCSEHHSIQMWKITNFDHD